MELLEEEEERDRRGKWRARRPDEVEVVLECERGKEAGGVEEAQEMLRQGEWSDRGRVASEDEGVAPDETDRTRDGLERDGSLKT